MISAPFTKKTDYSIPEGTYFAILTQIIFLGHKKFVKKDGTKEWFSPILWLGFELPDLTFETKEGTKRKTFGKQYFFSISEKAKLGQNPELREIIEALRGSEFTEEEESEGTFDIDGLIGSTVNIRIAKDMNGYDAITNIEHAGIPFEATGEKIVFGADDFSDEAKIDTLPQFIQNKIRESKEYAENAAKTAFPEIGETDYKIADVAF